MKDNVHEGHRQRLSDKILSVAHHLNDHELLEFLLFPIIPRKDTNPLAHRLINVFGSLQSVFTRSKEELLSLDGVGERVAAYLIALGEVVNRAKQRDKENQPPIPWISINQQRKRILSYFKDAQEEKFIIVLLNKDKYEVQTLFFSSNERSYVYVDSAEVREKIYKLKAKYVIIMHNHPSGIPHPSEQDDYSVLKFDMFCTANGLTLLDSLVIGDDLIYSYKNEDRLETIKSTVDVDELYDKFKTTLARKRFQHPDL